LRTHNAEAVVLKNSLFVVSKVVSGRVVALTRDVHSTSSNRFSVPLGGDFFNEWLQPILFNSIFRRLSTQNRVHVAARAPSGGGNYQTWWNGQPAPACLNDAQTAGNGNWPLFIFNRYSTLFFLLRLVLLLFLLSFQN